MTRFDASTLAPTTNRYALGAIACLVTVLLVRVLALAFARTDLFFDEAQYWSWSQDLAFGYFSKPPLVAWIIALFTGLCGNGEFCVRLAAPVFYTGAAALIYLSGKSLYDARIGFWSALVFVTLPGISVSAGLISTDVPLLFFWTLALLAWIRLLASRGWGWAILLGLALGLGLLAKYAMIYFLLCAAVYLAVTPDARWLSRDLKGAAVLGLACLVLLPNFLWNVDNDWITYAHTAANAKWGGDLFKPLKMLEFIGSQFGVFGPILMGVLIWIAFGSGRATPSDSNRLLLSFSLPIILLITAQALLARAHANWAATAYPAAAIAVTAVLLRLNRRRLFGASLALHGVVLLSLAFATALAPNLSYPGKLDPFARVLGWRETAGVVRKILDERPYGAVLTEDRLVTAEMLYYLRDVATPVRSWRPGALPRDHYELSRPFRGSSDEPVLLVSLRPNTRHVSDHFSRIEPLGAHEVAAGPKAVRTLYLIALRGFKGR